MTPTALLVLVPLLVPAAVAATEPPSWSHGDDSLTVLSHLPSSFHNPLQDPSLGLRSPAIAGRSITLLDWEGLPATTLVSFGVAPADADPWQVDLRFPGIGLRQTGYLLFSLAADGPEVPPLAGLTLEAERTAGTDVQALLYHLGSADPLIDLRLNQRYGPIPGPDDPLKVLLGWTVEGEGTIGGITTRYREDSVLMARHHAPGPLPVLGGAAAFGFSRALRRRIRRAALPQKPSSP